MELPGTSFIYLGTSTIGECVKPWNQVRGQLLLTSQAGSVKASSVPKYNSQKAFPLSHGQGDAAALALRLQQLLAEREEVGEQFLVSSSVGRSILRVVAITK